MLKIKLARFGKKNERHYRIVVAENKSKLTGEAIDTLGHFHPLRPAGSDDRLIIDKVLYQSWVDKGAQPTDIIRKLVKNA